MPTPAPPGGPPDDPRETALRDLLCLTMISGVGPHTGRALLERFGTATAVLGASVSALRDVAGVGTKLAERVSRARREADAAGERERWRRSGGTVVPRGHPAYPPPLDDIPD